MAKLLFIPVSIIGGLAAGAVSRKLFDQIWGLVDEDEPPESKHRDVQLGQADGGRGDLRARSSAA